MTGLIGPALRIRTAAPADLPDLRRVFRTASLSNPQDAPLLLAHPQFLHFTGDAVADGRTRVAENGRQGADGILGFATVALGDNGDGELEDLFVDPQWHRRGVARGLIEDAVAELRESGRGCLWVVGNPQALPFYWAVGFIGGDSVARDLGAGIRLHLDV
ncbi:MAG: GNAT family N-acetyltransferase [Ornithinibacter sp.]